VQVNGYRVMQPYLSLVNTNCPVAVHASKILWSDADHIGYRHRFHGHSYWPSILYRTFEKPRISMPARTVG
jgi:hypothetical protein